MQKIPLRLLPYIFPGTSQVLWNCRARAGTLGPITIPPGKVYGRTVERAVIEKLYGPISEEQMAAAIAGYQRERYSARIIADCGGATS